jgi:hypothetical protein
VDGILAEFALLPGCYHDIDGMKNMFFNLSENSTPKRIHAVTVDGLLLKDILFIFVFTINEKFL